MSSSAYPIKSVESKWQSHWEKNPGLKDHGKNAPSTYVLEMFPYPSGKLHMGHVRNYAIGDAIARFKSALGFNVLHPMGWDAFGLPAENAAMEHNLSPEKWTLDNIQAMKKDFKKLGFSFDWDKEVATCLPSYYGIEQELFIEFYKKGLIERKESWVNWDPVEQTVLANEQVINGRGWRSNALVEKKKLNQWSFKITNYAQELLDDLEKLTGWPEKVVKMQENWIGRSSGALVDFELEGKSETITVFTTRPETLFGASFVALSPAHPLAEKVGKTNENVRAFIKECEQTPTSEEALATTEKKGIFTGLYAVHPFDSSWKVPVYLANFVLMDYGTGSLFGCPAHDERDHEFAKKYDLPIKQVISEETGLMIDSDFLTGLDVKKALEKAIVKLEDMAKGSRKITYRLRDWGVSRQRYWGCPIPMVHCENCGVVPVKKEDLPVKLPSEVTFGNGNPLDHHPTWKETTCPKCGKKAQRETDTLDTFFESSWYFLRFTNPHHKEPFDKSAVDKWMPLDWYIGGIEHAVLHLLYARFFTKALRDLGYITVDEPFKNLLTQGMVCHPTYQNKEGKWLFPHEVERVGANQYQTIKGHESVTVGRSIKMSKSKKNLVDPGSIIDVYGADVARFFILSDNPPEKDFEWNEDGLEGSWRFLNRLWRYGYDHTRATLILETDRTSKLLKVLHKKIDLITKAYEENTFNKVIAFVRELFNELEECLKELGCKTQNMQECYKFILKTLSPISPHICFELFEKAGFEKSSILEEAWPTADLALMQDDTITLAVQVKGKLRGQIEVCVTADEETLRKEAFALKTVQKELEGQEVKKVIIIPKRIINIVY
ncbi:MAG TPA: leucine--tRNA ligase [Alphaproteobacteria bacterium]|nr:leucine--tRNA ligase [Alphaproteobacteria bacterium]